MTLDEVRATLEEMRSRQPKAAIADDPFFANSAQSLARKQLALIEWCVEEIASLRSQVTPRG